MFIPQMVGALAIFILAAAAVLALLKVGAARWLAISALGLGVVAVGLAIETEMRHRSCVEWNAANVRYRPISISPQDVLMPGSPQPRECERWPW